MTIGINGARRRAASARALVRRGLDREPGETLVP